MGALVLRDCSWGSEIYRPPVYLGPPAAISRGALMQWRGMGESPARNVPKPEQIFDDCGWVPATIVGNQMVRKRIGWAATGGYSRMPAHNIIAHAMTARATASASHTHVLKHDGDGRSIRSKP